MNVNDEMSDADVLRAAADSLSAIPVPGAPDATTIVTAGRTRRRRRLTGWSVAGAAAVTVGALGLSGAYGFAGHLPSASASRPPIAGVSHQPDPAAQAQLTAWTVARLANGDISVTVNQFKDPAGLQSTLRSDGVPASVSFASQRNEACRPYPEGTPSPGSGTPSPLLPSPLLKRVFPRPYQQLGTLPGKGTARMVRASGPPSPRPSGDRTVIVIDPTALPRDAGVQLASSNRAATALLLPVLVYASGPCTG